MDNIHNPNNDYAPPQKPINEENNNTSLESVKKTKNRKTKEYYEMVYHIYIQWLAIPEVLRDKDEVNECQFANKYKIERKTLWLFAKREDFAYKLQVANKQIKSKKLQYMKNAIYNTGIMGKPEAQKLYLQSEEDFAEKTKQDINNNIKVEGFDIDEYIKIKNKKVDKNNNDPK
jgi:hypothetical protein